MVAPSILIDDLELHPLEEELPRLPVVPAPELREVGLPRAPTDWPLHLPRNSRPAPCSARFWRPSFCFPAGSRPDLRGAGAQQRLGENDRGPVRAGDAAGAAADHSVRHVGGHPDRPWPHGQRRRNHRPARRRRSQPQGDRAGHAVRLDRHGIRGLFFFAAHALLDPREQPHPRPARGHAAFRGYPAARLRGRFPQQDPVCERRTPRARPSSGAMFLWPT